MIDKKIILNNSEEVVKKLKSRGFEDAETFISNLLLLEKEMGTLRELVDTYKQLKNYVSETNARIKKIDPDLMVLWNE